MKLALSKEQIDTIKTLNDNKNTITNISKILNISITALTRIMKDNKIIPKSKYLKLTIEEKEWLKDNWCYLSAKECGYKLNKNPKQIMVIAHKMGLGSKQKNQYLFKTLNIDPRRFLNITEPVISYFLGLIWADGSIRVGDRKIALTMAKEDLEPLNLEKYIGKMTKQFSKNKKHPSYKEIMKYTFKSRPIYDFLISCGYKEKSIISPDLILEKIPENLKSYFYLGWLDGDGSINRVPYTISFAGSINQNWNSLIILCNFLDIKYNIYKSKNKRGKGSSFIIRGQNETIKFGKYIYNNIENIPFLFRKWNIWNKNYISSTQSSESQ